MTYMLYRPVCLSFFLRKSTDIISVIAIGHLDSHYLSSAGLASVTANVTGNSMIYGLGGALSTICSQAFGLKDYRTMSIALQRAIVILITCVCLPVSVLWLFSEDIMVALGQQRQIAHDASMYLKLLIPGLFSLSCSACIQNWLHSQSKTRAIAMITLITALLHPVWCYLMILRLNIGFLGAAIAVSMTKVLELSLLLIYVNFISSVVSDTQFKWEYNQIFKGLQSFIPRTRPVLPSFTY